jgi:hypothetical protein
LRECRLIRIVLDEEDPETLWLLHARPGGGKVEAKSVQLNGSASSDVGPRSDRGASLPLVWRGLPTDCMQRDDEPAVRAIFPHFLPVHRLLCRGLFCIHC